MPSILVIEDNPADVMLLETALMELRPDVRIQSVGNSEEALDFMYQRGQHSDAPPFDFVLLDLNMPGVDGHGLLEALRSDERLRHIPVAVWTSSRDNTDVRRAYMLGANAYYLKRNDYRETLGLVRIIMNHWFDTAQLPG